MIHDILLAIPWAFLLAISIGPGFFMILETSITKGFKAALSYSIIYIIYCIKDNKYYYSYGRQSDFYLRQM